PVREECLQGVELLTGAHELDGLTGGFPHGKRCPAARIAVDLGEDYAGYFQLRIERFGHVDRFLSGHGVHDQQFFGRLQAAIKEHQFSHQFGVDLQAPGCVEQDRTVTEFAGFLDGSGTNLGDISATGNRENWDVDLFSERNQLVDGGRTLDVASDH